MPNWVRNKLNVTGNQTEIQKLIETLQSENGLVDFDRVCPMPDGIRETAEWDSGYGNRIAYEGDSQKQAIIGEFLVTSQSTFLKEDVTLRHLFFTRFEGQKRRLKNESLIPSKKGPKPGRRPSSISSITGAMAFRTGTDGV